MYVGQQRWTFQGEALARRVGQGLQCCCGEREAGQRYACTRPQMQTERTLKTLSTPISPYKLPGCEANSRPSALRNPELGTTAVTRPRRPGRVRVRQSLKLGQVGLPYPTLAARSGNAGAHHARLFLASRCQERPQHAVTRCVCDRVQPMTVKCSGSGLPSWNASGGPPPQTSAHAQHASCLVGEPWLDSSERACKWCGEVVSAYSFRAGCYTALGPVCTTLSIVLDQCWLFTSLPPRRMQNIDTRYGSTAPGDSRP